MRSPNLIQFYYYSHQKSGKSFNLPKFIYGCQRILENERIRIAKEILKPIGFDLIPKNNVPDRLYRRSAKQKINGRSYVLIPKEAGKRADQKNGTEFVLSLKGN